MAGSEGEGMKEQDSERFARAFTTLAEYFEKPFSAGLMELYSKALSDISIEQFEAACIESLQTSKFFPKICEIRECINGNPEEQSVSAWEQLQEAVQREGAYTSVKFMDARIARTIEVMGGWTAVCAWPVSELQYRRQEFQKTYRTLPPGGEPRVLPGIIERENMARGFIDRIDPPLVIGGSGAGRGKLLEFRPREAI